ncbi:uncharacterized protein LOC120343442 [Styela clava]|uniref:uncharacterized protein LOC120343442 n=1 Tax=Styela clava TaxID=7725 RepID=UPI00193A300D|nr:uncharacterized protein LOC120343442 [Styela clava]
MPGILKDVPGYFYPACLLIIFTIASYFGYRHAETLEDPNAKGIAIGVIVGTFVVTSIIYVTCRKLYQSGRLEPQRGVAANVRSLGAKSMNRLRRHSSLDIVPLPGYTEADFRRTVATN